MMVELISMYVTWRTKDAETKNWEKYGMVHVDVRQFMLLMKLFLLFLRNEHERETSENIFEKKQLMIKIDYIRLRAGSVFLKIRYVV